MVIPRPVRLSASLVRYLYLTLRGCPWRLLPTGFPQRHAVGVRDDRSAVWRADPARGILSTDHGGVAHRRRTRCYRPASSTEGHRDEKVPYGRPMRCGRQWGRWG